MKVEFEDVSDKKVFVIAKLREKRLNICKACPQYTSQLVVGTCHHCGCIMQAKTYLKIDLFTKEKQECPEGKW